ncbi:MAG: hypothetical protein JETT_3354 [Candidatus Jettenia ecosi]|uniref:Uncharacterized protein n=1 Tax=Candidatus Jettenia ecosi TaxID=2494326 RepID=A0A533Q728_9BACT|nr:MAG: hypothetical protein JETT_3354 [Candidatus Jettenia ecosi]
MVYPGLQSHFNGEEFQSNSVVARSALPLHVFTIEKSPKA